MKRAVGVVWLGAVVVLALGYLVIAIKDQLWSWFGPTLAGWQTGSLPFYAVWIVVGLVALAAYPALGPVPWRSRRPARVAIALVLAGSLVLYGSALLRVVQGDGHLPAAVGLWLGGGLVGPIVEEWLFRGLLWNHLARAAPIWMTILVSSLVFGFWHMSFEGHTWITVELALMHASFGALMAVARWRTGGILLGCAIHVVGNSLVILAFQS